MGQMGKRAVRKKRPAAAVGDLRAHTVESKHGATAWLADRAAKKAKETEPSAAAGLVWPGTSTYASPPAASSPETLLAQRWSRSSASATQPRTPRRRQWKSRKVPFAPTVKTVTVEREDSDPEGSLAKGVEASKELGNMGALAEDLAKAVERRVEAEAAQNACLDDAPPTNDWNGKNRMALKDAMENGSCHGSSIYTKFNRLLKNDSIGVCSAHVYHKASMEKKLAFRKEWAGISYSNSFESKKRTKTWSTVDQSLGEMMTMPELLVSFGGGHPKLPTFPMALAACRSYALGCIELGGQWLGKPGLAMLPTFFRVRQKHISIFENKFALIKQLSSQAASAAPAAQASSAALRHSKRAAPAASQARAGRGKPPKAADGQPPKRSKRKGKAKAKGKGKAKGSKGKPPGDSGLVSADLSKAAAVCKAAYLQAIAGVSAVRSAIASSPDWGWCKPAFLEDLDKAEAKLKEVMEASGASSWVEVPVSCSRASGARRSSRRR